MTTQAEALAAAGRKVAVICDEQEQWYREGGPERVAAMGFPSAAPERQAQIAALYEQRRQQAIKDTAA